MGRCRYQFNPSELYQRTRPGTAPETICGALTHPAVDEPELIPLHHPDGRTEYHATGRMLSRPYDDPYCPAHGGSPEPPPIPVSAEQVQQAYDNFTQLLTQFKGQPEIEAMLAEAYKLATGNAKEISS